MAVSITLTIFAFGAIDTTSPMIVEPLPSTSSSPLVVIYNSLPYLAPLAWAALILTVIWKGKIRSLWQEKGYDYDVFKLVARTRGSDTRIAILRKLSLSIPKNKHQLANELEMDWKSIDGHISILMTHKLVEETLTFGTAKYFVITDKGKEILELLDNGKANSV